MPLRKVLPNDDRTGKSVRVLVVDDYEPWHRFISTAIQTQPELDVIGSSMDWTPFSRPNNCNQI